MDSKEDIKKVNPVLVWFMEYGWVIIAAIIAVGYLYYFGVVSPGNNNVSVNHSCLASEFCKDLGLAYYDIGSMDIINCGNQTSNMNEFRRVQELSRWKRTRNFQVEDNWRELDSYYKERCKNG